jgi:hypothetical protein
VPPRIADEADFNVAFAAAEATLPSPVGAFAVELQSFALAKIAWTTFSAHLFAIEFFCAVLGFDEF